MLCVMTLVKYSNQNYSGLGFVCILAGFRSACAGTRSSTGTGASTLARAGSSDGSWRRIAAGLVALPVRFLVICKQSVHGASERIQLSERLACGAVVHALAARTPQLAGLLTPDAHTIESLTRRSCRGRHVLRTQPFRDRTGSARPDPQGPATTKLRWNGQPSHTNTDLLRAPDVLKALRVDFFGLLHPGRLHDARTSGSHTS
jgi:hypothetical protein